MTEKLIDMGNGYALKTLSFEPWGGLENFLLVSSDGATGDTQLLRRVVPWLAKATDMTANAISELPFEIMQGKTVYDSSQDWQNKLGGMPSPQSLFYLLASSLCLGKAYLIPRITSKAIIDFQYCAPQSITPQIDMTGLQYFDRVTAQGASERFEPDKLLYFWLPDSDVEIGPAKTFPASTALLSAQLLTMMDGTIKINAEHGFVPPTVLAAKGMANPAERDKAETWWNRFLRRWTNTTAKIINSESLSVVKVGAGMDELRGVYGEITKQAIENIGTAFGIPAALFMSDMAFASEVNPMIKVWYSTSVFIKIYHTIEETFNNQLLKRWGLELKFRPDTIDAFQDDEATKAQALNSFADFLVKCPTADLALESCLTFGYELTPNLQKAIRAYYEKKEKEAEELRANMANAQPVPGQPGQPEQKPPMVEDDEEEDEPVKMFQLDAAQIKDLDLWRQVAVRNHKKGKGNAVDFECKALPDEIAAGIREKLAAATTEGEIIAAFEIKTTVVDRILALDNMDQIRRACDLLEAYH